MRRTRHSLPEYRVWREMRQRCGNPNSECWPRYGGRGIRVCERWHDFESFIRDMGRRPGPKYQIDRIDNDGDYEPDNCRWATPAQNARNSSKALLLTHEGRTQCLTAWANEAGMYVSTLSSRLKAGWSLEDALHTPAARAASNDGGPSHRIRELLSELGSMSVGEIARRTGVNRSLVSSLCSKMPEVTRVAPATYAMPGVS